MAIHIINNMATGIEIRLVTSIHIHIHNINKIIHCKSPVVAHHKVFQIIIQILFTGATRYSFINQKSLSQIRSIHAQIELIIVFVAMIHAAKNPI